MIKKYILLTNNQKVFENFNKDIEIQFDKEYDYMDVLVAARKLIHSGYVLETHPLSGSIKPNETPFKSIILSKGNSTTDTQSLLIIEDAIATYLKFKSNRPTPNWIGSAVEDFMTIDCSLIKTVIDKL
ncbi:MAG: GrdX family protein [Tissierellia bacterium]|nr:GrdX family protein [Tissierellia bacterium]